METPGGGGGFPVFQENICRAQLPSGDLLGSGYTEDVWESIVEMDTGVCVHVVYSIWERVPPTSQGQRPQKKSVCRTVTSTNAQK